MKYHLIIGYHLTEKNNAFPTIRINVAGRFIDEFLCDNQETTAVTFQEEKIIRNSWEESPYDSIVTKTLQRKFITAKKVKIFELDSSNWNENDEVCIEISNNKSNYNNGFMSKKSMVSFRPILLLPEPLVKSPVTLRRVLHKSYRELNKIEYKREVTGKDEIPPKWRWPCTTCYVGPENFYGGDTKIKLKLRKKLGLFVLVDPESNRNVLLGYPEVPEFFQAWAKTFLNYKVKITSSRQVHTSADAVKDNVKVVLDE